MDELEAHAPRSVRVQVTLLEPRDGGRRSGVVSVEFYEGSRLVAHGWVLSNR